jgi:MFS family permease
VAYGVAAAVLAVFLRPDPLLVARRLELDRAAASPPGALTDPQPHRARLVAGGREAILFAGIGLVLSQAVMVAVMTMTPVHLGDHGHGLGAVGTVIAVHIAAMYLPSPITGMLVDRIGRRPVMAAGGVVLTAAGVVAAVAPASSVATLTLALGLLGLGWNLTLVGRPPSSPTHRARGRPGRTPGAVDVSVALAGAAVVDAMGYPTLGLAGAALALLILPMALRASRPSPPASLPAPT